VLEYGIEHWKAAIAHQQANGQVERMVKTMKRTLVKLCNNHPQRWFDKLDGVRCAMNCTVSDTTGVSPYFALYGFEPRTKIEMTFPSQG